MDLTLGGIVVRGPGETYSRVPGSLAEDGPSEDISAPQRLRIARQTKTAQSIAVLLPENSALRRSLTLPLAARRNLPEILAFEVDRQNPLDSNEIHFDYRVAGVNKSDDTIAVEIRIFKRRTIDQAVSLCRRLNLEPDEIRVSGDAQPLDRRGVWAVPAASVGQRRARLISLGLGVLAGVLAAAMVFEFFEREQAVLDKLAHAVAGMKREVSAVERMRRDSDALAARIGIIARERNKTLSVKVLEETTRVLPDTTWVFHFERNRQRVNIRGYSSAAASLIAMIDGSPLFTNARFRAPRTQGPRSDLQRFDLSFDLVRSAP